MIRGKEGDEKGELKGLREYVEGYGLDEERLGRYKGAFEFMVRMKKAREKRSEKVVKMEEGGGREGGDEDDGVMGEDDDGDGDIVMEEEMEEEDDDAEGLSDSSSSLGQEEGMSITNAKETRADHRISDNQQWSKDPPIRTTTLENDSTRSTGNLVKRV